MGDATEPAEDTDPLDLPVTPPKAGHLLTIVGLVLTVVWMAVLGFYALGASSKFAELNPNEMGDFFAGAFAPLAFLWLVLGFFQQGKELRHSGEALWIQGRELQHSVKQQRELVQVTREQLAFESTALKHQQDELMRKARPILQLTSGTTSTSGDGEVKIDFAITNHGRPCTDVKAMVDEGNPIKKDVLPTGDKITFRKRFGPGPREPFTVFVTYIDDHLMPGSISFNVFHDAEMGLIITSSKHL